MNPALAAAPIEEIMERREIWASVFKRMADVDVVIITLGSIKSWYDTKLDIILNNAPDPRAIRRD